MTSSSQVRALDQALEGRHAYFRSNAAKAMDYFRHAIVPPFRAVVKEITTRLLSRHDVDPAAAGNVVHYTSLRALFTMIHEGPHFSEVEEKQADRRTSDYRFFRLYDSANVNDPSEGTYFLKRLVGPYDVVRTPAYIASFITPDEAGGDPATTHNNLVFWRHYGHDGRGCSISIPVDRFIGNRSALELRTVTYGSKKTDSDAEELRPVVERLEAIVRDVPSDPDAKRQVALTVLESLREIPYLYKSNAYRYENECRVVALGSHFRDHGGIHYAFEKGSDDSGRLRMYGQHPRLNLTNLLSTGSIITLGPAVPNAENVQYAIEQLLESIGIKGLAINRSGIRYRRTT